MKQRGEVGCRLRLQQTGFGKGVRRALTDDEVIHHADIDHRQGGFEPVGQRLIGVEVAREALQVFLDTKFEGGRHAGRVAKLSKD